VFVSQWGAYGTSDGHFDQSHGVAVASDGSVYVLDRITSRIQKFTSEGVFVNKWSTDGTGAAQVDQVDNPRGIAVAPDGSVYVADTLNHRIQKFSVGQ
jgi:DNA-binding beta-propeller fold protein YncE